MQTASTTDYEEIVVRVPSEVARQYLQGGPEVKERAAKAVARSVTVRTPSAEDRRQAVEELRAIQAQVAKECTEQEIEEMVKAAEELS